MRRRMHRSTLAAAAALAALLSGCNLAPQHRTPDMPVPDTVGSTAANPAQADEASLQAAAALDWVQSRQLREVIALALANNRDLRVAVENIERARAQYGITRADLLPSVNAQAQASRARTAAGMTSATQAASVSTQYTAQLGFASYEIDLWGRVRNLSEAALQQFLQSEQNRRNVQIGLVADVANAWLTLAADQARLQLARDTLASREKAYELTRRMHEIGSTSGLVLAQNQTTVDTARGDVASFTSQVERDRNALQLLVGGPLPDSLLPGAATLRAGAQPAAALQPVPAPLPSSVLLVRPDIQAAENNLRAMEANIGAARAAMFPTISLTASVGSGSRELDGLFGGSSSTWSFIPWCACPSSTVAATVRACRWPRPTSASPSPSTRRPCRRPSARPPTCWPTARSGTSAWPPRPAWSRPRRRPSTCPGTLQGRRGQLPHRAGCAAQPLHGPADPDRPAPVRAAQPRHAVEGAGRRAGAGAVRL